MSQQTTEQQITGKFPPHRKEKIFIYRRKSTERENKRERRQMEWLFSSTRAEPKEDQTSRLENSETTQAGVTRP